VDTLDLRVSSPLGNTGPVFVGFTFAIDGTLVNLGLTNARVTFTFGFNYDGGGIPGVSSFPCFSGPFGGLNSSTPSTTVAITCSTPLYPVDYFNRYSYFFSLSAQEHLDPSAVPVSGSASAAFFNTAVITSVQPYDANLNFMPDAVISSLGNNGSPFVNAPEVPEPSSFSLLYGGLALFTLGLIKRHCSQT